MRAAKTRIAEMNQLLDFIASNFTLPEDAAEPEVYETFQWALISLCASRAGLEPSGASISIAARSAAVDLLRFARTLTNEGESL